MCLLQKAAFYKSFSKVRLLIAKSQFQMNKIFFKWLKESNNVVFELELMFDDFRFRLRF